MTASLEEGNRIELPAGGTIYESARLLVTSVTQFGKLARAVYNGVGLVARPGDQTKDIVKSYYAEISMRN